MESDQKHLTVLINIPPKSTSPKTSSSESSSSKSSLFESSPSSAEYISHNDVSFLQIYIIITTYYLNNLDA